MIFIELPLKSKKVSQNIEKVFFFFNEKLFKSI